MTLEKNRRNETVQSPYMYGELSLPKVSPETRLRSKLLSFGRTKELSMEQRICGLESLLHYRLLYQTPQLSGAFFHECAQLAKTPGLAPSMQPALKNLALKVVPALERLLPSANEHTLTSVAWAAANFSLSNECILSCISTRYRESSYAFTPRATSVLLWAFAALQWRDDEFLKEAAAVLSASFAFMETPWLACALWSFATFNFRHDKLLDESMRWLTEGEPRGNERDTSNIAWAFAVLDPSRAREYLEAALPRFMGSDFCGSSGTQMAQACFVAGIDPPPSVTAHIKELSKQAPAPNRFEKAVEETLVESGLKVETQTPVHGVFIDLRFSLHGRNFALECDGAHHFRGRNPDNELLGNNILKDRILEKAGYTVVRLPLVKWNAAPDKSRLLRSIIPGLDGKQ